VPPRQRIGTGHLPARASPALLPLAPPTEPDPGATGCG
jgi:hypothetical protein